MTKKIFIGMLAVFILIGIATAGYKFGQYLAHTVKQTQTEEPSPA